MKPVAEFFVGLVKFVKVSSDFHDGFLQLVVAQFNIAVAMQTQTCHQDHHEEV